MANITWLTDNLYTGGDLPPFDPDRLDHLEQWVDAGITHVIDNRLEWSDEDLVAEQAPAIAYLHNGVDDAGQRMPDSWFDDGVAFALQALAEPDATVLAHCHMGINRGPSMALAILLALGWDVVDALDRIRGERPIAAVGYAEDALDWWHRRIGSPDTTRALDRRHVAAWRAANRIDTAGIIRQIRQGERSA